MAGYSKGCMTANQNILGQTKCLQSNVMTNVMYLTQEYNKSTSQTYR